MSSESCCDAKNDEMRLLQKANKRSGRDNRLIRFLTHECMSHAIDESGAVMTTGFRSCSSVKRIMALRVQIAMEETAYLQGMLRIRPPIGCIGEEDPARAGMLPHPHS